MSVTARYCLIALIVNAWIVTETIPAPAGSGRTIEERQQTMLDDEKNARDIDLAEDRAVCAEHFMPKAVRRAEAEAVPHPGTVRMCKAIITESLRRGAGIDLYSNYAVTELTGKTIITEDLDVSKILTNKEGATTFTAVRDGAKTDATSYKTVSGRELPLTTALALDAGAYAGYRQPDAKIAADQSDEDIERTIAACYKENSTHSRNACFLAGARLGQSVRRQNDHWKEQANNLAKTEPENIARFKRLFAILDKHRATANLRKSRSQLDQNIQSAIRRNDYKELVILYNLSADLTLLAVEQHEKVLGSPAPH